VELEETLPSSCSFQIRLRWGDRSILSRKNRDDAPSGVCGGSASSASLMLVT